MKSAAERQRQMRQRKRERGDLRQLNLWVQIETHEKLKAIALAAGKPLSDALRDALNFEESSRKNPRRHPQTINEEASPQLKLFE